ncbi:ATP-binding protein [Chloroflexota bacterium]
MEMKIAVCGKGGGGKSTFVTLLANELRGRGYRILVVDSDESNAGLFRMLGFNAPPIPLMDFLGGKKGLKEKMATRLSSGDLETKMNVLKEARLRLSDIPTGHILRSDGLRLMNIGKILHSLEGCACPMGVLSREFLGKLELEAGEMAIVDMEAGVEHFGRGVETNIDTVVAVVEPSFESLELAMRIKDMAQEVGIKSIWAVLNKVTSDAMETMLKEELDKRSVEMLGALHYDDEVFEDCLSGRRIGRGRAARETRDIAYALLSKLGS